MLKSLKWLKKHLKLKKNHVCRHSWNLPTYPEHNVTVLDHFKIFLRSSKSRYTRNEKLISRTPGSIECSILPL